MSEPLFVEERRRAILDQLKQQGRVSVKALSEKMSVSAVTIRQDLRVLEENGLLERTYGGAVRRAPEPVTPELSFDVRQMRYPSEKAIIGAAAAALVKSGHSIALDASTTSLALVSHLKTLDRITVVTNSLIIAKSFLDSPRIQVLIPGGRVRRDSISVVGRPEGLPDINLNYGFFGTRGITLMGGITDTDPDEVMMKKAMIARCVSPVIIADGSKWGHVAPYTFINPQEVERIITTDLAPMDLVAQFRSEGVQVDVFPASD